MDTRSGTLRAFTLGAAASEIIGSSTNRCRLTFYPPLAGSYTVNTQAPTANGDGIVLAAGAFPITLDIETDGQIVQNAWQGFGSGAGTLCALVETLLPGT